MEIILSSTFCFSLKKLTDDKSLTRWIYFGSNPKIQNKLKGFFARTGEEINFGEKLYKVSQLIRDSFVQWLDDVSLNYENDIRWMLSAPAVRNTYISNLFLNVCYFKVFERYIKENKEIDCIFVDSPALAKLIRDTFPAKTQYLRSNMAASFFRYGMLFLKSVLRFFRYLIDCGLRFICAQWVFGNRKKEFFSDNQKIVLIRNFISEKFADNDNDILERHFFPGLYKHLKKNSVTPVFLPIIIKPTNYLRLFKKVLASNRNIFFFEEFLKINDYFFAFLSPFRSFTMKIESRLFQKNNINELLKEDFFYNLTSMEFLYSMLLTRLGIRLKEVHCNPEWIINWSENQTFEKGIIKGLKTVFREMKVIGAQPFIVPPNYLSPVYTKQEQLNEILPDRILCLGPIWEKVISERLEDLNIEYSPAFRYTALAVEKPAKVQGDDLLVLLGIDLNNTVHILCILLKIYKKITFMKDILIKLHPASNFDKKKLELIIGERFPELFKFIGGRLDQYFENASVGLCGASGTSVELVMKGIPVVTIGETHTLTMNYLEYKEDSDIWQICFSADQVLEALKHFNAVRKKNPDIFVRKADDFRSAFIVESDDKYWQNCYIVPPEKVGTTRMFYGK